MIRGNERIWILGGVLATVLLAIIGWFIAISPTLSSASNLNNQKDDANLQNRTLQARIDALTQVNMADMKTQLTTALLALPTDSGLPEFTRQLKTQADQTLVKISSIGAGGPAAQSVTTPATAGGSAGASSGGGGIFMIPISLQVAGNTANLEHFLQKIQSADGRRALVTSVSLSPSGVSGLGGPATLSISLELFSAPQSPATVEQFKKLLGTG